MASLQLDVCLLSPTEPAAQQALDATHLLSAGDRDGADRLYRSAAALPAGQVSGWNNLAALGIALGDFQDAYTHAYRAVEMDRAIAAAWVTLGVASWHVGKRRDAAQCSHRALELSPGLEAAALNLDLMYRIVGDNARSRGVLTAALARRPQSARLQMAMAEVCRLLGDAEATRQHALSALSSLLPTLAPAPGPEDGPEPEDEAAQQRLFATMADACDRLQAAGIEHCLVGAVVVGIARQGRPFAGDKDVDFALAFDTDRDLVLSAFADGYTRMRPPPDAGTQRWCMGFIHDTTGISVDLYFKQQAGDVQYRHLGWPDDLKFEMPTCRIEPLQWQGRDWPMPAPLESYLHADFGEDWRSPRRSAAGREFDKRWLDSQISRPSLLPECLPRAINLVLVRLLSALRAQRWPKALALCDQLLERMHFPEVEAVRDRLLAAGIR